MVAPKEASVNARVGALAKSAGQPCAGKPHARLEEGAPVGQPCEDIQAPPTERGGNSYGLATANLDRALLYNHVAPTLADAFEAMRLEEREKTLGRDRRQARAQTATRTLAAPSS